jgi:hypothetical protein
MMGNRMNGGFAPLLAAAFPETGNGKRKKAKRPATLCYQYFETAQKRQVNCFEYFALNEVLPPVGSPQMLTLSTNKLLVTGC